MLNEAVQYHRRRRCLDQQQPPSGEPFVFHVNLLKVRFLMLVFALPLFCVAGPAAAEQLRDGDIIFHTSCSTQSAAIQKATHSRYSHVGMVLLRHGSPYVYEAISTVQYTPLQTWIARGNGGHYVVKSLRNADTLLTPEAVAMLRQVANTLEGKPYDLTFEWSDSRIYCSELVWKIYERGLGLRIGNLQKLRDFDLSDPVVKAKMQERYGKAVPLEETVISPGEMFAFDGLMVVEKH